MLASTGTPKVCSVIPNVANTPVCPAAVAPPWLPMAGTTNGLASSSSTTSTIAFAAGTRSVIPRLPNAIATESPGRIDPATPRDWSSARTAACTSTLGGLVRL